MEIEAKNTEGLEKNHRLIDKGINYDLDLTISTYTTQRHSSPPPSGNPCTYSDTCSCARTCGGSC